MKSKKQPAKKTEQLFIATNRNWPDGTLRKPLKKPYNEDIGSPQIYAATRPGLLR